MSAPTARPPGICDCDLIWRQGLRAGLRWVARDSGGPGQCPCRHVATDTRRGRRPCADRGQEWRAVCTGPGLGDHQKLEKARKGPSLPARPEGGDTGSQPHLRHTVGCEVGTTCYSRSAWLRQIPRDRSFQSPDGLRLQIMTRATNGPGVPAGMGGSSRGRGRLLGHGTPAHPGPLMTSPLISGFSVNANYF